MVSMNKIRILNCYVMVFSKHHSTVGHTLSKVGEHCSLFFKLSSTWYFIPCAIIWLTFNILLYIFPTNDTRFLCPTWSIAFGELCPYLCMFIYPFQSLSLGVFSEKNCNLWDNKINYTSLNNSFSIFVCCLHSQNTT